MPLTGSARSAPKALTISKLLHSQHLSDDQHRDDLIHSIANHNTRIDRANVACGQMVKRAITQLEYAEMH